MSSAMSETVLASVGDPGRDGVTDLRRTTRGTGDSGPPCQIRENGLLDLPGRVLETDVVEQQCSREDRGRRVGLLLTSDVRSRAVHGLEHAGCGAVGVDVAAGGQTDPTGDRGRQVRDDVAEE